MASARRDSYSFSSTEGTFKASSRNVELAPGSVTGYRDVSTDNEQTLMSTVARQTVSAAIEADLEASSLLDVEGDGRRWRTLS